MSTPRLNRLPPVQEAPTPPWMLGRRRKPRPVEPKPEPAERSPEPADETLTVTEEQRGAVLSALGRLVLILGRAPTVEQVAAETRLSRSKAHLILRGLAKRKRGRRARSLSNGMWTVVD